MEENSKTSRIKWINVDNIHYNITPIMSLTKKFNYVISPREPGKSTSAWRMLFKQFIEKNRRLIVLKRMTADITESYVDDIAKVINKFLPIEDNIKLIYSKGNLGDGVCDIYVYNIKDNVNKFNVDVNHLWFRIISMSIPSTRFKSQIIPNLEWILFDEFIPNTRLGERYLNGEVFKFEEIYNTFRRESENLRCLFLGNPYSLYNPYFSWLSVPMKQLKIGKIITGDKWAVEFAEITPQLREWILQNNPLFEFDDSYTKYAFNGVAVNDENIWIDEVQPKNSKLMYVFRIQNKILGVFRKDEFDVECDYKYWICVMNNYSSTKRNVTCFDVNNLLENSHIHSRKDNIRFEQLARGYRWRMIAYKDLEASYLMDEIYELIR